MGGWRWGREQRRWLMTRVEVLFDAYAMGAKHRSAADPF